jgi:hypothetical protein
MGADDLAELRDSVSISVEDEGSGGSAVEITSVPELLSAPISY